MFVHNEVVKLVKNEEGKDKLLSTGSSLESVWERVELKKPIAEEYDLCAGDENKISVWTDKSKSLQKKETLEDWEVMEDFEVAAGVL